MQLFICLASETRPAREQRKGCHRNLTPALQVVVYHLGDRAFGSVADNLLLDDAVFEK